MADYVYTHITPLQLSSARAAMFRAGPTVKLHHSDAGHDFYNDYRHRGNTVFGVGKGTPLNEVKMCSEWSAGWEVLYPVIRINPWAPGFSWATFDWALQELKKNDVYHFMFSTQAELHPELGPWEPWW